MDVDIMYFRLSSVDLIGAEAFSDGEVGELILKHAAEHVYNFPQHSYKAVDYLDSFRQKHFEYR